MTLARKISATLLAAVAVLSIGCQKEAAAPPSGQAQLPGEPIYYQQCAICHGRFAKGDTMIASNYPWADLTDGKWGNGSTREEIIRNVTDGIPQTPMRGFKGVLTDQEIGQVVDYVLSLQPKK